MHDADHHIAGRPVQEADGVTVAPNLVIAVQLTVRVHPTTVVVSDKLRSLRCQYLSERVRKVQYSHFLARLKQNFREAPKFFQGQFRNSALSVHSQIFFRFPSRVDFFLQGSAVFSDILRNSVIIVNYFQ